MSIKRIYIADQPLMNRIAYKMQLRQQELSKLSMSQHMRNTDHYRLRKARMISISKGLIDNYKSIAALLLLSLASCSSESTEDLSHEGTAWKTFTLVSGVYVKTIEHDGCLFVTYSDKSIIHHPKCDNHK